MRIVKKKFLYIISPNKIQKNFYKDLVNIFKLKTTSVFQLRLKKYNYRKKIYIAKKIKQICRIYKVKFVINDDVLLASKLCADGCHLGQSDMNPYKARKILGNKIIGVTCHNSIKLVREALNLKVDYIAIGSFFNSSTKKTKFRTDLKFLRMVRKISNVPIVAIGGINEKNFKKLLLHKADFLAISGDIWRNKKLSPVKAVENIRVQK